MAACGGRSRWRGVSTALMLSCILPSATWAQVAPQVPQTGVPSREEIQRTPETAVPPVSAKVRSDSIPRGTCPEALVQSSLSVALTAISFTGPGGAALPPRVQKTIAEVGKGLIGTQQPIRIVCDIRDATNAALSRAGYVATVRVPEQTIEAGQLRIEIVTARIAELRVRGQVGGSRERIEAVLNRLRALDPLNERDAERLLLLAGDIPGTAVTLELRQLPGGQPGEVIGEILIERAPGALFANIQNYGSREIGRFGGLLRGEVYGLTGMGDRTFLGVFSTADGKEQQVVQAGHDLLVGSDGLRLGTFVTYAWTKPEIVQNNVTLDLESKSLLWGLTAAYPLFRQLNRNIYIGGGFELIEQRTRAADIPINEDKLRVLSLRLDGDVAQRKLGRVPAWRLAGSVELRKGLTIFDATERGDQSGTAIPTRFEGDPTALVVRGNLLADLRSQLPWNDDYAITLSTDARGQYTEKPLLAFEEFAVGNLTLGRGYDPGSTSADRAIGAATELRIGKPQPLGRNDLAWEVIAFYDAVRIWNLDSGATETDRTLDSYGGGLRLTWGDRARFDLLYAKPRDKALTLDSQRPTDRLLVSLTTRLWPWRQ